MNLVCEKKYFLSLSVEILWMLPSSTTVSIFLEEMSILYFSLFIEE